MVSIDGSSEAFIRRPPRLVLGDGIAVVSPSGPAAGRFPERLRRGLAALAKLGFNVRTMPNATAVGRYTAGTVEQRVEDIHQAFLDPQVAAIVCAIGGRLSSQLLEHLDLELIGAHPKVFCGFSDATTLHSAIGGQAGLVTFYGPAILPDWAELPEPAPEMVNSFRAVTGNAVPFGEVACPPWEIVEHVDWGADRLRERAAAPRHTVLCEGRADAPLGGGCLPVLCELLGTRWFPPMAGRVLFLDLPPTPYSPADALSDLWHLRNAGVFKDVAGVLVSRPPWDSIVPNSKRACEKYSLRSGFPSSPESRAGIHSQT